MKIYVYADTMEEVERCKAAIHSFISQQRDRGKAVTANKITDAVTRFGNNLIITNFL